MLFELITVVEGCSEVTGDLDRMIAPKLGRGAFVKLALGTASGTLTLYLSESGTRPRSPTRMVDAHVWNTILPAGLRPGGDLSLPS